MCFGEALRPEFKEYQKNIAENARVLAQALLDEGLGLVSGGTDNHLMTVDLRGTGAVSYTHLYRCWACSCLSASASTRFRRSVTLWTYTGAACPPSSAFGGIC